MYRFAAHSAFCVFVLALVGIMLASPSKEPAGAGGHPKVLVLDTARKGSEGGFGSDQTVIARDASGQFHLQAQVDGEDTTFLIDTGADVVALTEADAERLGIEVMPDDFRPIMETASGTGYAARITLDRLALGDDEFDDVDAVVVRGLGTNLLGQSVLRRLGKVELQGDRMVIRRE
jgi:aspartyl protease family protein